MTTKKRRRLLSTKCYFDVGKKAGLKGKRLEIYVVYMKRNWEEDEEEFCRSGFAKEWAERFVDDIEMYASDYKGKGILKELGETNE